MGRHKLLLPWPPGAAAGGTVIRSSVNSLLDAEVERVIVVLGHKAEDIGHALKHLPVQIALSPDPGEPMGVSVGIGMRSVPEGVHVILLPGDHPAVRPETIRTLMRVHDMQPKAIHVPVYQSQRGHPAIFPIAARNGLLHPHPLLGVRALFQGKFECIDVAVDDPGIVLNLDLPEDYPAA
jgi:CTP:molybdopterin cytidylyltransferase MocA